MAAPQQQPGQDTGMGILWAIAAIFALFGFIWYAFKNKIIGFYFTLKVYEINFLSLFTHKLDDVKSMIQLTDPSKFTFQDMMKVGDAVGTYLRFPFVILLFALAFIVYFTNVTRVFKRTYSMKDLVHLEKTNWPQITAVADLDLIKTDIDQGPWAMAMTPMQFCKKNNLLEEHKRQMQEGMTRKEWNRIDVTLKRGQANKLFALQIGPLWQGADKLPPYIRALFAVFAARFNSDTKPAYELLMQMAGTSTTQLNLAGAIELSKKHENTKGIQKIVKSHAYVMTVMASMLEAARDDGVQATADFLWLKPVDRKLWYMLNVVGRQTPFVEVAGPFAHWKAEKEIGRPLLVPMVEEATNALDIALKEIVYQPDEKD
jgi:intracellular multiplication protein IcmP